MSRLLKKVQRQGARRPISGGVLLYVDVQSIERNEAYGSFSPACEKEPHSQTSGLPNKAPFCAALYLGAQNKPLRRLTMNQSKASQWIEVARGLGEQFAERAEAHDEGDTFVSNNYAALKERRVFSAAIPKELGGGGASHREIADMLRTLAQYCGSTALALSMHQHLIAATVWKYRRGQGGEPMLKNVAEKQLVLVSTGAGDWLESNGSATKTDGGYLVSAHKHFASQSAVGDVLVTSAPFMDEVLHFSGADERARSHRVERLARARHERHRFSYRQIGKRLRPRCRHRFGAAARRLSPALEYRLDCGDAADHVGLRGYRTEGGAVVHRTYPKEKKSPSRTRPL